MEVCLADGEEKWGFSFSSHPYRCFLDSILSIHVWITFQPCPLPLGHARCIVDKIHASQSRMIRRFIVFFLFIILIGPGFGIHDWVVLC